MQFAIEDKVNYEPQNPTNNNNPPTDTDYSRVRSYNKPNIQSGVGAVYAFGGDGEIDEYARRFITKCYR